MRPKTEPMQTLPRTTMQKQQRSNQTQHNDVHSSPVIGLGPWSSLDVFVAFNNTPMELQWKYDHQLEDERVLERKRNTK